MKKSEHVAFRCTHNFKKELEAKVTRLGTTKSRYLGNLIDYDVLNEAIDNLQEIARLTNNLDVERNLTLNRTDLTNEPGDLLEMTKKLLIQIESIK